MAENRLISGYLAYFYPPFCHQTDLASERHPTAILLLANLEYLFILQLLTGKQVTTSIRGETFIFLVGCPENSVTNDNVVPLTRHFRLPMFEGQTNRTG